MSQDRGFGLGLIFIPGLVLFFGVGAFAAYLGLDKESRVDLLGGKAREMMALSASPSPKRVFELDEAKSRLGRATTVAFLVPQKTPNRTDYVYAVLDSDRFVLSFSLDRECADLELDLDSACSIRVLRGRAVSHSDGWRKNILRLREEAAPPANEALSDFAMGIEEEGFACARPWLANLLIAGESVEALVTPPCHAAPLVVEWMSEGALYTTENFSLTEIHELRRL